MRVLVACEFSGVVRDAFRSRGHFALSCDLLPTEAPGPHYQGDIKDLPLLKPTNVLELPPSGRWSNQTPSGHNNLGPSPDRWKLRSITYQGLANAMAEQWSN